MGHSLTKIARCTGLPVRQLRYVLYHGLVPNLSPAGRGRGATRIFTLNEARSISIAAALLRAGLSREPVRVCLLHICDLERTRNAKALTPLRQIKVEDQYYLECDHADTRPSRIKIDPDRAFPPIGDKPLTTIQVNVEELDRLLTMTDLLPAV